MAKMSDKPKGYELVPFQAFVPAAPIPAPESLKMGYFPEEMAITGVETQPTAFETAKQRASELLRHCRYKHEHGSRTAVLDLVRDHPELVVMDAWLCETLLSGKLLRKKRGRPRGSFYRHPLVVLGMVLYLQESGVVRSVEAALGRLEELGFGSYETLKASYYQGRREERFKAVMKEYPEGRRFISDEEGQRLLSGVRVLGPGEALTYTGHDPQRGDVTITFRDLG